MLLRDVQDQIEAIYESRGGDFILPVRYRELLKLESALLATSDERPELMRPGCLRARA
jgi:hypothetical protein